MSDDVKIFRWTVARITLLNWLLTEMFCIYLVIVAGVLIIPSGPTRSNVIMIAMVLGFAFVFTMLYRLKYVYRGV